MDSNCATIFRDIHVDDVPSTSYVVDGHIASGQGKEQFAIKGQQLFGGLSYQESVIYCLVFKIDQCNRVILWD